MLLCLLGTRKKFFVGVFWCSPHLPPSSLGDFLNLCNYVFLIFHLISSNYWKKKLGRPTMKHRQIASIYYF
jgi:hypothetical protein